MFSKVNTHFPLPQLCSTSAVLGNPSCTRNCIIIIIMLLPPPLQRIMQQPPITITIITTTPTQRPPIMRQWLQRLPPGCITTTTPCPSRW